MRIGGHFAAAICGKHPFISKYQVYLRMLGLVEDQEQNEAMEWGKRHEPTILAKYKEGKEIEKWVDQPKDTHIYNGVSLCYNPDAFCLVGGKRAFVDAKTARLKRDWGEPGTNQVPEYVLLQQTWYMLVSSLVAATIDRADIAVLFMGCEYAEYTIKRNQELCDWMLSQVKTFIDAHIIPQIPPEPDASDDCKQYLQRLYNDHGTNIIEANDEQRTIIAEYLDVTSEMERLCDRQAALKNSLCACIGDNAGITSDAARVTWKSQPGSSRVDTKRLKSERPDVYQEYVKQSEPIRVFRVQQ